MQYIQKSLRKYPFKNLFINSKKFTMETKFQFEILKIETEMLADLIRVDGGKVDIDGIKAKKSFVIIDVRGDDYQGGHIAGAINIPSSVFMEQKSVVDNLIEDHNHGEQTTFIFHCMESQIRGPTCARKFAEILKEKKIENFTPKM
jgi:rhodanese-related sulfurtransferase